MEPDRSIPAILNHTKDRQDLTTEALRTAINAALAPHLEISSSAINSWLSEVRRPDYSVILLLYEHTPADTWLNRLALELLQILRPELYPVSPAPLEQRSPGGDSFMG